MKNVDISVVIPAYNVGSYIECMIDTLFAQTFKNFEIIIVDDCSTDNTIEILDKYNDDRIRLIKRKENSGGCYAPREDGVMVANGNWIVYLDADDYVEATYLTELFERVNLYNVDVCSPQMIRVDDNLEPNGWSVPNNDFDFDRVYTNVEAYNLTVPEWRIGMNGAIVKKSVYIAALNRFRKDGKSTTRSDEILSRVILLAAENGYVAAKTRYYYRYNPSSITSKFRLQSLEWAETNADFIEFVRKTFGVNGKEFRNVLMYDFYCYYSSISQFIRQVDREMFKAGLAKLKKWHKRQKWSVLIKDAKKTKQKSKVILCRFFNLSAILLFFKWKRLSFLIRNIW